jgi:hydrogenase nickel incorporation protein HypA/HybF
MSIVHALLEQVEGEVERSGHTGRVLSLDLVIGRMSGVHVDAIRFAFEVLAPDTLADAARLQIKESKASLQCRACDCVRKIDELQLTCPECESSDITIQGGQELILESIELEDQPPGET